MTINYTTLLGLAKPVTGTESGVWGDVVNDQITSLVEDAIANAASISVTSGNVTLTDNNGSSDQSRMAILLVTGSPGVSRNIVAPSTSKWYIVKNSSNAEIVLKGSATTGVTIPAGAEAFAFWNGSDFELAAMIGPSSSTDNAVARFDGTTGKVVQNSAVTIADTTGDITTGGYVFTAAGAAGTPAYSTSGDTNTGMWFPAADTIAFSEGGTEAMRLDSSGNVGIGTTTTTSGKLTVATGNTGTTIRSTPALLMTSNGTNTDCNLRFSDAVSYASEVGQQNGGLYFTTSALERMRVAFDGNVGIGTNNPGAKLEVTGDIQQTWAASMDRFVGSKFSTTYELGLHFIESSRETRVVSKAADSTGLISFYTGVTPTERARITAGGDVGIGRSPSYRLDVLGSSTESARFSTSGSINAFYLNDSGTTAGTLYIGTVGNDFRVVTGSNERMRVTNGGEVYIAGTTDQGAYNLQVNGTGVWGAGAYVNGSDERLKDNIQTLNDGLEIVTQLRPVTFQYKQDHSKDQSIQPGFIAQELQQAMAGKDYLDGVVQSGPEYLNVAYQNLIPILTKAIQELKSELDTVKAELAALKGA